MNRTDRVNEQNRIKILQQKKKWFGLNRIEKDCFIPQMLNGNSFQYVKRITWHPFFFLSLLLSYRSFCAVVKICNDIVHWLYFFYIVSPSTFIFPTGCFLLFLFAKILFSSVSASCCICTIYSLIQMHLLT